VNHSVISPAGQRALTSFEMSAIRCQPQRHASYRFDSVSGCGKRRTLMLIARAAGRASVLQPPASWRSHDRQK
jgi:hypothetical protein